MRLFTSGHKWHLFKYFEALNIDFSVVILCIFEDTCTVLELPFHVELNGFCPNSVY